MGTNRRDPEKETHHSEIENPEIIGHLDDQMLNLLGDFLESGNEGLETADHLLMDIEHRGMDNERVNGLFRVFHSIKGMAGMLGLVEITAISHQTETLLDKVRKKDVTLKGGALDVIFDATSMMRRMMKNVRLSIEKGQRIPGDPRFPLLLDRIQSILDGQYLDPEQIPGEYKGDRLGEILEKKLNLTSDQITEALQAARKSGRLLGEELVARGLVNAKEVGHALRSQRENELEGGDGVLHRFREFIKVELDQVDSLIDLSGQLAVVESMISYNESIVLIQSPSARGALDKLTKLAREIQNQSLRLRMVPIRSIFMKMDRIVRDLAKKSGKTVELVQIGAETEIDRKMLEKVDDPLVHMTRNAVDHGIESHDERISAGKEETGTVTLSAYHEGSSIVIEVKDDGKGLDREAILNRAREKGLVKEGADLFDREIFNLLFKPGFTTVEKATEISGHGVGMDVVKKNIEALKGRVNIESTQGEGSSFKMILPITMAVIDGMIVHCGSEKFVIPTLTIVESVQLAQGDEIENVNGRDVIKVRDRNIPMLRLDGLFNIEDAIADPGNALFVVLESVGGRIALMVDRIKNLQQVVVQSFESEEEVKWLSGETVLSDGRVALILDVDEITSYFNRDFMLGED